MDAATQQEISDLMDFRPELYGDDADLCVRAFGAVAAPLIERLMAHALDPRRPALEEGDPVSEEGDPVSEEGDPVLEPGDPASGQGDPDFFLLFFTIANLCELAYDIAEFFPSAEEMWVALRNAWPAESAGHNSAMEFICSTKKKECLWMLVFGGPDDDCYKFLLSAIGEGWLEGVGIILHEKAAYVNRQAGLRVTHPLVLAIDALQRNLGAYDESWDIVQLLLSYRADPNGRDRFQSCISAAIRQESRECVQLLAAHGADISARDVHTGKTPLMLAADRGWSTGVLCLCSLGADVNVDGEDPFSLVRLVIRHWPRDSVPLFEILECFVRSGVDVDDDDQTFVQLVGEALSGPLLARIVAAVEERRGGM